MIYDYNDEKNELLFNTRGITFYQVIEAIERDGILLDFDNPRQDRYPGQKIMVVSMNDYTYCVPYLIDEDRIFMKTVYPDRRFLYLLNREDIENG